MCRKITFWFHLYVAPQKWLHLFNSEYGQILSKITQVYEENMQNPIMPINIVS